MPACMAGCVAICTPIPFPAFALCMSECTIACGALSCVSMSTAVTISDSGLGVQKPVSAVTRGDLVLTTINDVPAYTPVLNNVKTNGSFTFKVIKMVGVDNSTLVQQLIVTPEHGLVFAHQHALLTIDTASNLEVGDLLIDATGKRFLVVSLDEVIENEKYTLETSSGTYLANGILVSSLCGAELEGGEKLFKETIADWQSRHYNLNVDYSRAAIKL